jgi:hypothetical protein
MVIANQTNVPNSIGVIDSPYEPSQQEVEELQRKLAKIKQLLRRYGAKD